MPPGIEWLDATDRLCPVIAEYTDSGMAEGVGWKYAPPRIDPRAYELHLDNDCILWAMPDGLRRWLEESEPRCLLAEDVATMLGRFAPLCDAAPRNAGIRGVPPGFDLSAAFRTVLEEAGVTTLESELDEQGLVTVACSRPRPPHVIGVDEVSICGPFPPHRQRIGTCGAHFVGLNAKRLPWRHDGRWGESYVRENWHRLRPQLVAAVRMPPARGVSHRRSHGDQQHQGHDESRPDPALDRGAESAAGARGGSARLVHRAAGPAAGGVDADDRGASRR